MKKHNYKISIFLAVLLLSAVGCRKVDDKFLQTTPETFYTVDNIFSTSAQIDPGGGGHLFSAQGYMGQSSRG